tara:strand:- start:54 stop:1043 length:990 start_codon:yes stop_codon:yes gene_type:complete
MANKKISQLTTAANVGAGDYFPVATAAGSNFITKKAETETVATYVLSPVPSAISQIGFTGNNEVYFDKNNWTNASNESVQSFPFLQVRASDGLLVTGSGVAFDSTSVPWDYNAASSINMQGNDINNLDDITFKTSSSSIERQTNLEDLLIKAGRDLTISGIRDINIKSHALKLTAPIVGDATFSKGGLTIPDGQGVTGDKIEGDNIVGDDIVINKTSRHVPHNNAASLTVNWANSNIQFDARAQGAPAPNYSFTNPLAGQTLTMYVDNNHNATVIPTFTSGIGNPVGTNVKWGGPTGGPPHLVSSKTNVYTFVCYDGAIFASAVTGYAY